MQENQSGETKHQYHPELILLFNSAVIKSALIGNLLTPILFVYATSEFVPHKILLIWLIISTLVALFRVYASKRLTRKVDSKTIQLTLLATALGGSVWGLSAIFIYLYAPDIYIYFSIMVTFGMIAGASSTLIALYRGYLYYAIVATFPYVIGAFLKFELLYIITAVLLILFTIYVLVGGYHHYSRLHEAITLKNKLKSLNTNLEGEVKKRTHELETLNNSLEDKVKAEIEKNRDKDQQLVQQSRMAQMGEMISMIAHQWRQPLGAIAASSIDLKMKMAFASFDLEKKEDQEACTNYFDEQLTNIENYVQSLTTTIDDFRNFYKPNKEKKTMTINEPIKKSLSIIEAAAKANGVDIVTNYESQKSLALYDSELMQVFLNIIKNAQDNFKEKESANATIMIETKDTHEGVQVTIADNGGGIPESIISKIFDPYFSTKDEKNGTGLGLYMSKTIIEEHHDGKLDVTNRDNGVTFYISLKVS